LVWFLHSDSPFSRQKKIALSLSKGIERGVATFYDLPDIPDEWDARVDYWNASTKTAELVPAEDRRFGRCDE
jgi:hypothetical protein